MIGSTLNLCGSLLVGKRADFSRGVPVIDILLRRLFVHVGRRGGMTVTALEKSLYVAWIGRLGKKKASELTDSYAGKLGDRIRKLVESSNRNELNGLLISGFDGYFHQTAFLRTVKKHDLTIKTLSEVKTGADDPVRPQQKDVNENDQRGRFLLMVNRRMEFISDDRSVVAKVVPFPVLLDISKNTLILRVMTMQSGPHGWGKILDSQFRRKLTVVRADFFYEQVLGLIGSSGGDTGEYLDCSKRAIELMKSERVDTFGGRFAAVDGDTTYRTVHGKGKKALRESRPKDFESLINATRIIKCELEFRKKHFSLDAGSKVALYPSVGKVAFRSSLEGCSPDDFTKAMAK